MSEMTEVSKDPAKDQPIDDIQNIVQRARHVATRNINVQVADNHRVTARLFTDNKLRNNRNAGAGVPPESAYIQDSFVIIPQFQYQGVLGPNMFLDARFSYMDMDFPLAAKVDHPDFMGDVLPPSIERTTGALLPGSPPAREVRFLRNNADISANLSYYLAETTRSHDMKLGGNFSRVSSFSPDNRGYIWGFQQQFLNGEPDRVRFWNHSGGDIFNTEQPDAPSGIGHFFLLLDPVRMLGPDGFAAAMHRFKDIIVTTPPAQSATPVLFPGQREQERRRTAMRDGVAIPQDLLASIQQLARGQA